MLFRFLHREPRPPIARHETTSAHVATLVLIGVAAALTPIIACQRCDVATGHMDSGKPVRTPLRVFAAASTTDVLSDIAEAYEADGGTPVTLSFAASSALAQQIVHGAEADLFISANARWMEHVAEAGLAGAPQAFASNKLVVIVPRGSSLKPRSPHALTNDEVTSIALGDPTGVPAGIYAKQSLERLGIWDDVASKVVAARNVRAALAFIETGAAEAGIVYATDAAHSDAIDLLCPISEQYTPPIRYWACVLKATDANPEAEALLGYLRSADGRQILARHGFLPIAP